MYNTLFLVCPTDCLESIINNRFQKENYFYTSLGNSFALDFKALKYIKALIAKYDIKDIYFVISSDNKIVKDALGNQSLTKIRGLDAFYSQVQRQNNHVKAFWETKDWFPIMSYYLNKKIEELEFKLNIYKDQTIKIGGKIYNREKHDFSKIYSNLICLEKHYLN